MPRCIAVDVHFGQPALNRHLARRDLRVSALARRVATLARRVAAAYGDANML